MKCYTVKVECQCSQVEGELKNISPQSGNHIKCMCIDCQTFAHFLEKNEELLDSNGATELFQISPSQITFTKGEENIKALRLSLKGPFRWYTKCCQTPIANTIGLDKDFAGVFVEFMKFEEDHFTKQDALGEIKYYCMAKYSKGEPPAGATQGFPRSLFFKVALKLLLGKLTKNYLPNPFFNEENGLPINECEVLEKEKRQLLRERC